MDRKGVFEITKHLRNKITALKATDHTLEHNLYVGIRNQYQQTLLLIDLVNSSPRTSPQMLSQFISDCGVTHFVRIFSYIEFNIKKTMLLTKDSSLEDLRNKINNNDRNNPAYLFVILKKLDNIMSNERTIKNLQTLSHVRNIILHNNEIADATCTYNFDKSNCGTDCGKIILEKDKRIVLSSPDLLIRLADLLLSLFIHLQLALIAGNVIDIDEINQTRW